MRLLDTKTLQIREFHSDIPQYAILSHTWVDGEEVTLEDMAAPSREIQTKAGYQKILQCCNQAVSDKWEFIWVDTCCIDKRSSAELSEAINSMYRWYADAKVCYAYLPDVKDRDHPESEFANSRWFRRGWTLQELVAPSDVVFFGGEEWFKIGTKANLRDAISRITKIDISILRCSQDVFKASIAQRMSWASARKTTRKEDLAYSLLGIFGVNMPLLYGEGDNAFVRLQLELLNLTNDHTIFAWSIAGGIEVPELNPPTNGLYQGISGSSLGSRLEGLGLLAPSVDEFSNCGNVKQSHENFISSHYMTNIGLCITLPTILVRKRASIEYHAFLDCYQERPTDRGNPRRICLRLRHEGNSRFCRVSIGERSVRERNFWARMTPMFITRTRLDPSEVRSLPGSVIDARTRPTDLRRSENHDESLNSTSDDETDPLLGDAETAIRESPSSNRHAPGLWPSGQRLPYATRNILSFLAINGVCLLIILFPLGIFAGAVVVEPTIVFVLDFLAILALAPLLRNARTRLSATLGYSMGGLVNAFFGNAVEMIVSFG